MASVIEGDLVPFDKLADVTDWSSIKKVRVTLHSYVSICSPWPQYYKLNGEPALKAVSKDPAQERRVVEEIVTSSVAMKSVMA